MKFHHKKLNIGFEDKVNGIKDGIDNTLILIKSNK